VCESVWCLSVCGLCVLVYVCTSAWGWCVYLCGVLVCVLCVCVCVYWCVNVRVCVGCVHMWCVSFCGVCVFVCIGVCMYLWLRVVFLCVWCVSLCSVWVCVCACMWLEKLPGMTYKTRLNHINTRSKISGPIPGCKSLIPISTYFFSS